MYNVIIYLLYKNGTWVAIHRWYLSELLDHNYEYDWILEQVDSYMERIRIDILLTEWIIKGWTYEESNLQVVK